MRFVVVYNRQGIVFIISSTMSIFFFFLLVWIFLCMFLQMIQYILFYCRKPFIWAGINVRMQPCVILVYSFFQIYHYALFNFVLNRASVSLLNGSSILILFCCVCMTGAYLMCQSQEIIFLSENPSLVLSHKLKNTCSAFCFFS